MAMSRRPFEFRTALVLPALVATSLTGCLHVVDDRVAVSSTAAADYSREKFGGPVPKTETYVFMPGRFFSPLGVDHSIDGMSFRTIAESLAPELARKNYLPAKEVKGADLLLVVHWGATRPHVTTDEMRGVTMYSFDTTQEKAMEGLRGSLDPIGALQASIGSEADRQIEFDQAERLTDQLAADYVAADSARLLGYTRDLRRHGERLWSSTDEVTLRSDLATERYFIIVRAYDLRHVVGRKPRAVWTLHLNMRSPGHNFPEALTMMGDVAVSFFGRETQKVDTVIPKVREGTVTFGDIIIVGEPK